MNINDFKHKINVTIRFHEVDMLGVCNNAVYINYFEHARLQYIKDIGLMPKDGIFSDGQIYFMVRNEINYRNHAYYDEELNIYTRISYIKNSSYGFEHLITKASDNSLVADGSGVVVHVDPATRKSTPIDSNFRKIVSDYEINVKANEK
ncbi:MAG: hypothetical protein C0442_09455 [Chlorobiaceae bacterium]|nr:hypothetical protein [Chlorobiaceae bacterium]